MKRVRETVQLLTLALLVLGSFQAIGWAQSTTCSQDTDQETTLYNVFDVTIARPGAVLAGVAGAGLVILSLPFTIPTKSVDKATDLFVLKPFKFAFKRDFPDEDILSTPCY